MSPNPDEIYWAKAATDPVAPITLWIYPRLRNLDRTAQRPVLESSKRNAMNHWLSRALRYAVISVWLVQMALMLADRTSLFGPLMYVFQVSVFAWLVHVSIRTRMELRSAVMREKTGAVDA